MIVLLFIAWPFLLLLMVALILAFTHTRWRCPVRHILVEGICIFVFLVLVESLFPLKYDRGWDTVHAFCGNRFVMDGQGIDGYSVSDGENGSSVFVSSVFRWAERKEGCYLISMDRHFHFLDPVTDTHQEWNTIDDVPDERKKVFRDMTYWGPYGQFWEDLFHAGWRNYLHWGLFFAWVVRSICLLVRAARGCAGNILPEGV